MLVVYHLYNYSLLNIMLLKILNLREKKILTFLDIFFS